MILYTQSYLFSREETWHQRFLPSWISKCVYLILPESGDSLKSGISAQKKVENPLKESGKSEEILCFDDHSTVTLGHQYSAQVEIGRERVNYHVKNSLHQEQIRK
jgi:hypothetical protein